MSLAARVGLSRDKAKVSFFFAFFFCVCVGWQPEGVARFNGGLFYPSDPIKTVPPRYDQLLGVLLIPDGCSQVDNPDQPLHPYGFKKN